MRSRLLLLFSLGVSAIAVTITGPSSLPSCEVSHFSFSDGVAPYTFVAMAGAGASSGSVDRTSLPVVGTDTVYYPTAINGTPMQFYAVDSTNTQSNILTLAIEGTGTCVSSLSIPQATTDSASFASAPNDPTTAPISSATTRSSAVTIRVSASTPTTSSNIASSPTLSPQVNGPMPLSYILAIALCSAGLVLAGLLFALCYVKRRRARRNHMINPDAGNKAPWTMLENEGSRPTLGGTANDLDGVDIQSIRSSIEQGMVTAPVAALTLPSSKELRMRGAVQRLDGAESTSSVSRISSEYSPAPTTSAWPSASGSDRETQQQRDAEAQQTLQALINRELQEMLRSNSQYSPPPSATSPSPMTSNPFLSSEEKDPTSLEWDQRRLPPPQKSPLSLSIPQTSGTGESRGRLTPATTPISQSDMEVLAELVARRLLRDREANSSNSVRDVPPPSYS